MNHSHQFFSKRSSLFSVVTILLVIHALMWGKSTQTAVAHPILREDKPIAYPEGVYLAPIEFDEPVSSSIGSPGQNTSFTFAADSGTKVFFRLTATSGNLEPKLEIIRPNGTLLCEDDTIFAFLEQICELDASGTHTIFVSDRGNNSTGSFELYIQRAVNPANPTEIVLDEIQSSSISPGVELDAFTFEGQPDQQVFFRMTVTSGDLEPDFRVFRANGTLLCETDTIFDHDEIICMLDSPGTHTIFVGDRGGNSSGSYNFYIQQIVNPANPTSIVHDEIQSASISPGVEMDAFMFEGQPGEEVFFRMTVTSGDLEPKYRIYRPNGTLLCETDTIFDHDEVICMLDSPGTHVIFVGDRGGNSTGSYNLYIQRIVNPANSTSIFYDEPQSSSISPGVEMDAFTFEGQSGEQVFFRMSVTSGDLEPKYRIYRPDGTLLCATDTIFAHDEVICMLDSPGTHAIFVGDRGGNSSGSYDLYIQRIVMPVNNIATGLGKAQTGSISPGLELDAYSFNGSAEDRIEFGMLITSGALEPAFRVYRPDGTLLCQEDTIFSSVEITCELDTFGVHYIFVADRGGTDTGSYTLNLTCIYCPNTVDLAVTMQDSPDPVQPDGELTYVLDVSNSGPLTATNVVVTDTLPADVSFVTAVASQGSCTHDASIVTCNLGTINNGNSTEITLNVTPTIEAGALINTAHVASFEIERDCSDNDATVHSLVSNLFPVYLPIIR